MKNISPEKNIKNTKYTIVLFIIFFCLSEFFIMRPLRNKLLIKQNNKNIDITNIQEDKISSVEDFEEIKSKNISINNDYIDLKINTRGLFINNLTLKKYKKSVNSEENVKIFSDSKNDLYFFNLNWLANKNNVKLPTNDTVWISDKEDIIKPNDKITFVYDNKEGLIFKVILSLDEKYMINIEQYVQNNTDYQINIKPVWQINKKITQKKDNSSIYSGGIGYFNDKLQEIKIKKLKNSNKEFDTFSWAGLTDKYWLVTMINSNIDDGIVNFLQTVDNVVKVQYTRKNNIIINSKDFNKTESKIFIGPKDLNLLKEYQKNYNLKLFDRTIDFGIFYVISKPMFLILNFFYKITKNFGFAILLLTVCIKMLLYPTVKKSFISMSKMKKIQPKLKNIQDKYSSDKIKLQQEIMKLYKEYDLNPLSGIIPLFIQIPVFFSLYKVISMSIDMRQAPFIGFIKDLSIADPTNILNVFGLLPFNFKFSIGLLPCIMALTMFIQQKITEKSQDTNEKTKEQMKQVNITMKYMPLMFLFMFAGFPSGLLLYWIFNNIITILQQLYINKKYNL